MNKSEIKKKLLPFVSLYPIERLGLFGSAARGDMTSKSDVDLLIEMPREVSLFRFIELKQKIEEVLNRTVDLVEYGALKPKIKDKILQEQIVLYDKRTTDIH